MLVARRKPLLDQLCAELEEEFKIQARAIKCDLGAAESLSRLLQEVSMLKLDYLVNNAGFGSAGAFIELDAARELEMIAINVTSLVQLTQATLPGMLARKRGKILNIGSTAGFQPGPFMATYYATKAFVNSWSEALGFELKGTGVSVTVSCPGSTNTEFGHMP
ncbi:MAG: SDR family NAD(P)-dependent oxidoreductase [Polyangiaceae bacterium]|nr:SDR family NAD(P)-dependent oxidoreductase [Polyangiaceae bacterium]